MNHETEVEATDPAPEITEIQRKILHFLHLYIKVHNFPPTLDEIAKGVKMRSAASVHYQMSALREKGYIMRMPGQARSITLLREPPS